MTAIVVTTAIATEVTVGIAFAACGTRRLLGAALIHQVVALLQLTRCTTSVTVTCVVIGAAGAAVTGLSLSVIGAGLRIAHRLCG